MAVRLGKRLGTGPETWINMQSHYDLWRAKQTLKRTMKRIRVLKVAA
jgi:antitoxin HigA-1